MARIAFLSRFALDQTKGGSEVYGRHIQKALPPFELFTLKECPPLPYFFQANWHRLFLEEVKQSWWLSLHFLKKHREHPYDLVITASEGGWFLALKNLLIPRLHIYHGCFSAYADCVLKKRERYFASKYIFSRFEKLSGKNAFCLSVSEKVKREIQQKYRIETQVLPISIDTNIFAPIPKEEAKEQLRFSLDPLKPIGLFVGQAQFGKGWDIVEGLAAKFPHCQFVAILSNVPRPRLANIFPVQAQFPNEKMAFWYNAADFLLLPSRYESASFVTLEAMACNLPVVVSEVVASACLENGVAFYPQEGFYAVPNDSIASYGEAIQTALAKRERGKMRGYVEHNRSFLKFKEKVSVLIDSILNKSHE